MNMPVADDGTVHFSTTLFALIRESLDIRMGPGSPTILIIIVAMVQLITILVMQFCDVLYQVWTLDMWKLIRFNCLSSESGQRGQVDIKQ